jgi:hypothetical protein
MKRQKRQHDPLQRWAEQIGWKRRVRAVCKPCWELKYCPYGPLVEEFPLLEKDDERSCRIFGHHCPVFYVAEPLTETRELRAITRSIPRPVQFRVLKRDNQICAVCRQPVLDGDIHFDHIIPWSKGGPTAEHNIRLLCSACNRKRGNAFEAEHLVNSFVEHVTEPADAGFVDLLRQFVTDAHAWKKKHGEFPTPEDVCRIVGVREVSPFEQSMSQLIEDLDVFFQSSPPREIVGRVFRALKRRWGFARGNKVMRLAAAAEAGGVSIDTLVTAEAALVRRLGWPVKTTAQERQKWSRL